MRQAIIWTNADLVHRRIYASVGGMNLWIHMNGLPTSSPRDRPVARQSTRELMSATHTYPWLIPIITWCRQSPPQSTNILLIKSKLKLESRAIVVGVAMSPRKLGGKYRCRPHPRWRKCTHHFFFTGSRACPSNCIRVASSLGDTVVDHLVCLKTEFVWHTVLSNAKASSTHTIYIRTRKGRYVF